MKTKIITKTSIFPASGTQLFKKLQKLSTLQHIAFPYASFEPVNGQNDLIWRGGESFDFEFRLFCFIPFGIHKISVIDFDVKRGIFTKEGNRFVPIWNHRIIIEPLSDHSVRYTDEVEIGTGLKTPFVCLWAKLFYAHRQKRWIKLLKNSALREDSA